MARAFPDARIHTTLYDPESTYPEFADHDIVTSPLNRIGPVRARPPPRRCRSSPRPPPVPGRRRGGARLLQRLGARLPAHRPQPGLLLLPRAVALPDRHLPRRPGQALGDRAGPARAAPRPAPLGRAARPAAATATSRSRASSATGSQATYGIDADVLPAPHSMAADAAQAPVPELEDWASTGGYHLVVSRLLPYKNVDVVVDAVRGTEHRLVVVGAGPGRDALLASMPGNVRLLSGLTDAQLRWVYAHTRSSSRRASRTTGCPRWRPRSSAGRASRCGPGATSTPCARASPGCTSTRPTPGCSGPGWPRPTPTPGTRRAALARRAVLRGGLRGPAARRGRRPPARPLSRSGGGPEPGTGRDRPIGRTARIGSALSRPPVGDGVTPDTGRGDSLPVTRGRPPDARHDVAKVP